METLKVLSLWYLLAVIKVADSATFLQQSDFDSGAYVISEPGEYILNEDIIFNPHFSEDVLEIETPELCLFPTVAQRSSGGKYNGRGYSLGFFAAIVVQADDVIIDLNQRTLSQGLLHSVTQRFFSLIELANSPFPPAAGPANFSTTSEFVSANNVIIRNGRLDGSAHHGIHGNHNDMVTIENLVITNFEVVGISLNQVTNLRIENVDIKDSKRDVAVNGRLSQAIFSLQALSVHLEMNSVFDEMKPKEANALLSAQAALRNAVYTTLKEVNEGKPVSNPLFASLTKGLPDASLVGGILINPKVFVGDMLKIDTHNCSNIVIKNVNISRLAITPTEMSVMVPGDSFIGDGYTGDHITDNVGAVFDLDSCFSMETGKYIPNVLADFQIAIAAYGLECLGMSAEVAATTCLAKEGSKKLFLRNKITPQIVNWARGKISGEDMLSSYSFLSNRDFMIHTTKGAIGFKFSGTTTLEIQNLNINTLENHATLDNRGYHTRDQPMYTGFDVKAVSLSSSENIVGTINVDGLYSAMSPAHVTCVDYQNDVRLAGVQVIESTAPVLVPALSGTLPHVNRLLPYIDPTCSETEKNVESSSDAYVTKAVKFAVPAVAILAVGAVLIAKRVRSKKGENVNKQITKQPESALLEVVNSEKTKHKSALKHYTFAEI